MNIMLNEQTWGRKEVVCELEAGGTAVYWAWDAVRGKGVSEVHQTDEQNGGRHPAY
jgi:hypothetical protein